MIFFRAGDRVYLSTYPRGYEPTLFDPPRVNRPGVVIMSAVKQTAVQFDDGRREVVNTIGLYKGEPPK